MHCGNDFTIPVLMLYFLTHKRHKTKFEYKDSGGKKYEVYLLINTLKINLKEPFTKKTKNENKKNQNQQI